MRDWKNLVDEWVNATAAIANTENTPDPVSPADMEDEEEGLPSPPLDEGALWATQTPGMQLSEFFDGMDDDGNFRINDDVKRDQQNGARHPRSFESETKQQSHEDGVFMARQEPVVRQAKPLEAPNGYTKPKDIDNGELRRQESALKQAYVPSIDKEDTRRHEPVVRETKPRDAPYGQVVPKQSLFTTGDFGPGRPPKPSQEKKISGEMNGVVQRKSLPFSQNRPSRPDGMNSGPGRPPERRASGPMNGVVQRKNPAPLPDKPKNPEDSSLRAKLEAAKRKLQENYQNAENAKRQRTVQVMELQDIPKKAHINRQPVPKHKSNIRNLLKR